MNLPYFVCVGTQKGGTTYLHGLLDKHPQVYLSRPKELHYFSLNYCNGIDWYSAFFDGANSSQICGEFTPYYLFHPLAPSRINKVLPSAKILVLLRDPVERAVSHYFHSKRLGLEDLALPEALAVEGKRLLNAEESLNRGHAHLSHQQHSYLSRSRYERQLIRYRKIFPENQIKIYRSESLFLDTDKVWSDLLNWLGLDWIPCPISAEKYSGSAERKAFSFFSERSELRSMLQPTYKWLEKFYSLYW